MSIDKGTEFLILNGAKISNSCSFKFWPSIFIRTKWSFWNKIKTKIGDYIDLTIWDINSLKVVKKKELRNTEFDAGNN